MATVTYPFAHGSTYRLNVSGVEQSRAVFTGKVTDLVGGTTDISLAAEAVADELLGGSSKSHYPRTGEQAALNKNDLPLDYIDISDKYRCGATTFKAHYGRGSWPNSHDPLGNANDNAIVTGHIQPLSFSAFLDVGLPGAINAPPWAKISPSYVQSFAGGLISAVENSTQIYLAIEQIVIRTVLSYDPRSDFASTNSGSPDDNGNPIQYIEPFIGTTNGSTIGIARSNRGLNEAFLKPAKVRPILVYDAAQGRKYRYAVEYEIVWWPAPGHQVPDFYSFLNNPGSGWHDRYVHSTWSLPTHSGVIQGPL